MLTDKGFVTFLRKIWDLIKHIYRKIINFVKDLVNFFKDPQRMQELRENSNYVAIAIKDRLASGEYNVVNCLFDKDSNNVVDLDMDAEGIEAEELDAQTRANFGNKDMILFN